MEIRPVRRADLTTLASIYVRVYEDFDVGERWGDQAAHRLLAHYLHRRPDLALLAHERGPGGRLLGAFFADVKPWWDGNHLTEGEVFVDPADQGKGVGSALLTAVFAEAVDRYGVTMWEATTFAHHSFPMSWYRTLGFEQITEWVLMGGEVAPALERLRRREASSPGHVPPSG